MNRHPVVGAVLWMSGALVSFMLMAISGRELAAAHSTFEILAWRSFIGLAIAVVLLSRHGWGGARTERPLLHLVRNAAHFGGQYGWFHGIAVITLAEVFAIEFTVPIWAALFAVVLLGERLDRARITAIVLGIAGTLVILRPGIHQVDPAALAVLAGAVGYALSHVLTKRITAHDGPLCIVFYMNLLQLPMALVPAWGDLSMPAANDWPWILVVGVSGLSAHFCMASALRLADATVVVPLDFLRLPLIALVGYLFYAEPIDFLVLAGALLMLAGNTVNLRAATRGGTR